LEAGGNTPTGQSPAELSGEWLALCMMSRMKTEFDNLAKRFWAGL